MCTAAGPLLSRRALLAAGATAGLATAMAGCTSKPETPPPPDPDDLLREQAAERERALLREYDAALLALPSLAGVLVPLRGQHSEHLLALLGPQASPSALASEPPAPASQPAPTPAAALAALVESERAAGAAHGAAALEASRELAGLLAALSASELSHPVVLR